MTDREITFRDAIQEALLEELARSPDMFIMGENLIAQGGVFGVHGAIVERHRDRLVETPISEPGFVGMAVGAAMTGGPVVCEIMFQDFITVCMDEIVNQAAKLRYMSGGQTRMPLVIRAPCGMGRGTAAQHTQALESWFVHVPGLHVVVPSTPADAKGLLKTALRGTDPVMFFEYKMLYATKGPVSDDPDLTIPLGQARVMRPGTDITCVAIGSMVPRCLEAAEVLASAGISLEIVDPRSLSPLDTATIFASVEKTSRAMIVEEATPRCAMSADIAATIAEQRFGFLDGPVRRLNAPHAPKPFSPVLERHAIPSTAEIVAMARHMMGTPP
jgi:pyruvate/2-oxoglutarate/acetoin dehydrogenase E1 component